MRQRGHFSVQHITKRDFTATFSFKHDRVSRFLHYSCAEAKRRCFNENLGFVWGFFHLGGRNVISQQLDFDYTVLIWGFHKKSRIVLMKKIRKHMFPSVHLFFLIQFSFYVKPLTLKSFPNCQRIPLNLFHGIYLTF